MIDRCTYEEEHDGYDDLNDLGQLEVSFEAQVCTQRQKGVHECENEQSKETILSVGFCTFIFMCVCTCKFVCVGVFVYTHRVLAKIMSPFENEEDENIVADHEASDRKLLKVRHT